MNRDRVLDGPSEQTYNPAMRLAVSVLAVVVPTGCQSRYTPPAPHISGPDSGFVGIPVEFTASYSHIPLGDLSTIWYWGNDSLTQTWDSTFRHTFGRWGTYEVSATGFNVVYGRSGYHEYFESETSNVCTLRILDTTHLRQPAR